MQKILPMNQTHISDTSGGEVVDIISATSPYFENWLYTNYTRLIYATNPSCKHNMIFNAPHYTDCPFWNYDKVEETDDIKEYPLENVRKWLSQNAYIFMDLNERFCPDSICAGRNDFIHHHLLFGFSDEEHCVYYRGINKNRQARNLKIDYDSFEASVKCRDTKSYVELLTVKPDFVYEMNWDFLYDQIQQYNEGFVAKIGEATIYAGSIAEEKLIDIIEDIKNHNYGKDIRQLATFKEHKYMLKRYMDFFIKNGILKDENICLSVN